MFTDYFFFPERQLRFIEEWKREDIVFYDRTRAFEAAWNMVNSNTYITLIGYYLKIVAFQLQSNMVSSGAFSRCRSTN
jgi:hypothetical protein